MYYAIDFDSLTVESISKYGEDLASYVLDNNLTLAVTVVSDADDIELNLSLDEMKGLYANTAKLDEFEERDTDIGTDNESEAAERCWELLEQMQAEFPVFTKILGKKLLKKGSEQAQTSSEPDSNTKAPAAAKQPKKQSSGAKPTGAKVKDLIGMSFIKGEKEPRSGTSFTIFIDHLNDNMGEATFDELVQAFIANYVPKNPNKPVDESLGKAYVRDAYNGGFIQESL